MLIAVPSDVLTLADRAFVEPNDTDLYWISLFFFLQCQMLLSARNSDGRFYIESDVEEAVSINATNIESWLSSLANDLQTAFVQSGE